MYTVYADKNLVYSPLLEDRKYIIFSPKITMELNRAGDFSFTIPPNNPSYNKLLKLKTIIRVEEDGVEIWRGRVLNDEKDFYKNKMVYCEGELAFLNDVIVPPYDYSKNGITAKDFFENYIGHYNNNCSSYRKIIAGKFSAISNSILLKDKSEEYTNVLSEIIGRLPDQFGGYLDIRHESDVSYIDYLSSESHISKQPIRFGENMMDLDEYIDASEVYTRMIPLGKSKDDGSRVDITSVNNGNNYISSTTGINAFGVITKVIILEDVEDPSTLLQYANALLSEVIKMAVTITINAVDLHLLRKSTERIKVGYYIPVISKPHGIDSNFLCSKISLDLINPEQSEYTLGLTTSSLTDKQVKIAKKSNSAYSLSKTASGQSSSLQENISQNYVGLNVYNTFVSKTNTSIDDLKIDVADLKKRVTALEKG